MSSINFLKNTGEVVFYIDKDGCHVPDGVDVDESAKTVIGHLDAHIKNLVDPLKQQRDELLEALEEVVAISDRKHNAWDKAKQAIAKAKGE